MAESEGTHMETVLLTVLTQALYSVVLIHRNLSMV